MINEHDRKLIEEIFLTSISEIRPGDLPRLRSRAYQRWHPDKYVHQNNPVLSKLAQSHFVEIERLVKLLADELDLSHEEARRFRGKAKAAADKRVAVQCPECGALNRLPPERMGSPEAHCGKCGVFLFAERAKPKEPSARKIRIDCPHCGAANRLPQHRLNQPGARCGKCRRPLFDAVRPKSAAGEEARKEETPRRYVAGFIPITDFCRRSKLERGQVQLLCEGSHYRCLFFDGEWYVHLNELDREHDKELESIELPKEFMTLQEYVISSGNSFERVIQAASEGKLRALFYDNQWYIHESELERRESKAKQRRSWLVNLRRSERALMGGVISSAIAIAIVIGLLTPPRAADWWLTAKLSIDEIELTSAPSEEGGEVVSGEPRARRLTPVSVLNACNKPLRVAARFVLDTSGEERWETRGTWKLGPGELKAVFTTPNSVVYFHATQDNGETWGEPTQSWVLQGQRLGFVEINMGHRRDFTQVFSCN